MHRKFYYLLYVTCWCLSSFVVGCAGKKDVAGDPVGQPVLMAQQAGGQPSPPPGMRLGMGYMSALNEPCYELYAENEDIPQAQALCYRQGGWVAVPGIYMAVPRGVAPFSHHAALASAAMQASPMGEQTPTPVASAPRPEGDYAALFLQTPAQKAEKAKPKNAIRFAGLDDVDSKHAKKEKKESPKNITKTEFGTSEPVQQADAKAPERSGTDTLVAYIPGMVQSDAPMAVMSSGKDGEVFAERKEQPSNKKLRAADIEYTLGKAPLAVFASSLEQSSKLAAGKATKVASASENLLVSFAGKLADINLLSPSKRDISSSQPPLAPSKQTEEVKADSQTASRPPVALPEKKRFETFKDAAPVTLASVSVPVAKQKQSPVSVKKATVRQKKALLRSSGKKRPALGSYMDLLTDTDDMTDKAAVSEK